MRRGRGVQIEGSRAARRTVRVATLFSSGVPALAIVCVFACVGLVLLLSGTPGLGVLASVVLARLLLRPALTIVKSRRATPLASAAAVELSGEDEPALAALVRHAADALGLPAPDAIAVSLDTRVLLRREGRRTLLVLGVPWLAAASAGQATVAIAHALLAERAVRDTTRLRLVEDRLGRARPVVEHATLGELWRGYVRIGERLSQRAAAAHLSVADAACVRAFGNEALAASVQARYLQSAFADFWSNDVGPCLAAGFAPPLFDGWRLLLQQEWVAELIEAGELTPPAPHERVSLDVPERELERRLLAASYPDSARELVELEWAAVPHAVVLPRLRRVVAPHAAQRLGPHTAATLAQALEQRPPELESTSWSEVVAGALVLALVDAGWTLEAPSGAPLQLSDGEHTLWPRTLCRALAAGDGEVAASWEALVAETGVGELPLAPAQPSSPEQAVPDASATVVPPAPPVRLALMPPPRARRRAAGVLTVAGLPGLAVAISLAVSATMTSSRLGQLALIGFGLALVGGLAAWATSQLRPLLRRGAIVVSAEGVRVEAPGLLERQFQIPRTVVRAVMVDAHERERGLRFPMGPSERVVPGALEESGRIGWLWVEGMAPVVPLLGVGAEVPNLALLFSAPLLAPRVRHGAAGPLRGEAMTGLLLCVADPTAARAAFSPWDLTRPGSYADAEHVIAGFLGATTPSAGASIAGDRDA